MIAIRFIADHSFVSRAIGWRTNGKASHVEYVTVESGKITDTFGARLQGGIAHRPGGYCKPSWEEWYTFAGIEASYAEALTFAGRKYDWHDIADLALNWYPGGYDPMRAICSILVGYSNRLAWAAGTAPALVNPNVPTREMTPNLLYACVKDKIN